MEAEIGKTLEQNRELNQKILKMQRDNRYLQNLLDCWKESKSPRKEPEPGKEEQEEGSQSE